MPPKVKITKDDIINTALELVREGGESAINARNIAARLSSSTQPIFSNFDNMSALRAAVAERAYGIYLGFLEREASSGKYPEYKAFGMAYVRFAREERELFKLLFMCDTEGREISPGSDFLKSVEIIMNTNGISRERAERIHLEMWVAVHGISAMIATSFFLPSEELISEMLSDIYQGIREKHQGDEKNERS